MSSVCLSELSVFQSTGGKVLIPRTFTRKSSRSSKRGQTVMNSIRDYFPLVLVLVAVVTDTGAEGKNSPCYLFSPCGLSERSGELFSPRSRYLRRCCWGCVSRFCPGSSPFSRFSFVGASMCSDSSAALLRKHTP